MVPPHRDLVITYLPFPEALSLDYKFLYSSVATPENLSSHPLA